MVNFENFCRICIILKKIYEKQETTTLMLLNKFQTVYMHRINNKGKLDAFLQHICILYALFFIEKCHSREFPGIPGNIEINSRSRE